MTSAGSNHMDNPVHQSEILDNSDILSPLTGTTELPVDSVTMPQSEEHSPSQPKYPDVKSIKEPSPLKPTENLEGDSMTIFSTCIFYNNACTCSTNCHISNLPY